VSARVGSTEPYGDGAMIKEGQAQETCRIADLKLLLFRWHRLEADKELFTRTRATKRALPSRSADPGNGSSENVLWRKEAQMSRADLEMIFCDPPFFLGYHLSTVPRAPLHLSVLVVSDNVYLQSAHIYSCFYVVNDLESGSSRPFPA
jgi:hypothetical protein